MNLVQFSCVLILAFVSNYAFGQYTITSAYLSGGCTGSPYTMQFSPNCTSVPSLNTSILTTCSGGNQIIFSCYDLDCKNCSGVNISVPITCLNASGIFLQSTCGPIPDLAGYTLEKIYTNSSCSGNVTYNTAILNGLCIQTPGVNSSLMFNCNGNSITSIGCLGANCTDCYTATVPAGCLSNTMVSYECGTSQSQPVSSKSHPKSLAVSSLQNINSIIYMLSIIFILDLFL